jgi:hypothetical protein
MQSETRFLLIDGECESGLFNTLDDAIDEANETDASNCVIWEVVKKYEPGAKVRFKEVGLSL